MECISAFWGWMGRNAGQIQIFIAVIALIYARRAYRKVLKQIKISDRQTNISIDQMDKLNQERFFELKLRLFAHMNEKREKLSHLQANANDLNQKLSALKIITKKYYPHEVQRINDVVTSFQVQIQQSRDLMQEKVSLIKDEINDLNLEKYSHKSFLRMEKVLENIEKENFTYEALQLDMKNMDDQLNNMWISMSSVSVEDVIKKLHGFN